MQPSRVAKRGFLLLLAVTALVYLYGLGRTPFFGADEPRYAEVAREMYARSDLVTPTLDGRTWFEKPALGYWAQMAGFALLGVNERSARVGFALAGWLTVLLVGWMCGRVETCARDELSEEAINEGDESNGSDAARSLIGAGWLRLACAGVMASSGGLIAFSRAVNFDILLTVTVTLCLAGFFIAETERDSSRARLFLAVFYVGAGCALLAKGLVGIVIPFGVVGFYQIFRRRFPRELSSLLWGVPLMLLVAASWYAPVWYANGRAFFDVFIVQHHFARFATNKYHHPQSFYFYLLVLPLFALPWTPFLIAALKDLVRETWKAARGLERAELAPTITRLRLFAFAWLVVPILFFSVSQSKLPGYILPALPGAAVLAGYELWRYAHSARRIWTMRGVGCVMLFGTAGVIYSLMHMQAITMTCALIVAAPMSAGGVLVLLVRGSRVRAACVVAIATLLASMLAAACAQEGIVKRESVRELLRLADARGYASVPVVNLYSIERSSEFYAAGRVVYDESGEPKSFDSVYPLNQYVRERGATVLVVVPTKEAWRLTQQSSFPVELIGDNGTNALMALHGEAR